MTAGLSIRQIADRLGRSPATLKAYFYDPTGEKARAVKARYRGVCRGCGAYTQPRNGKGDAYAYCEACHPGAIERRWTQERVLAAMTAWRSQYGMSPTSYDWSPTHAGWRVGAAFERLAEGEWPASSVVTRLFGTWAVARASASRPNVTVPTGRPSAASPLGSNSISLFLAEPGDRIRYAYDFGDFWEHDIVLEKMLDPGPTAGLPACVAGKGACPPEDCGGVWGYADLRDALANPASEEHQAMLE